MNTTFNKQFSYQQKGTSEPLKRINFINGIRGWAAVMVLLYHFWVQVFPTSTASAEFLKKILFNGGIALYIFFIASGFSLTISYFNKFNPLILKKLLVGRYFRFIIPVGAASTICFIALKLGLIPEVDLRPGLFKSYIVSTPSFLDFFQFHFFEVLYNYDYHRSFIPSLWSIENQFLGSCLLLISLLLVHQQKAIYKFIFLLFICIITIKNYYYNLIFIGTALSAIYAKYSIKNSKTLDYLFLSTAIVSVWFFNYFESIIWFSRVFQIICLSCFFISVMYCKTIQSFLTSKISSYLGKISFSLYLIHPVVMWIIGINLVGILNNWAINCICIICTFLGAHFLTFFDKMGIIASRKIASFIFDPKIHKEVLEYSREKEMGLLITRGNSPIN